MCLNERSPLMLFTPLCEYKTYSCISTYSWARLWLWVCLLNSILLYLLVCCHKFFRRGGLDDFGIVVNGAFWQKMIHDYLPHKNFFSIPWKRTSTQVWVFFCPVISKRRECGVLSFWPLDDGCVNDTAAGSVLSCMCVCMLINKMCHRCVCVRRENRLCLFTLVSFHNDT